MIIKKLNGLFHKHSRWLFGAFTIVIIVSFMGFLTPGQFGLDMFSSPSSIEVGTAFGEKVTYGDLRTMSQRIVVFNEVFTGMPVRDLNEQQVFGPYCLVVAAKRLGLAASDKEVADLLQKSPLLQTDGKFDFKKYQTLLADFRRRGITDTDINDAFRDAILINKLNNSIVSGVVVTPDEVEQFYRRLNTGYEVDVATFAADSFRGQVKMDAKKLQEFFSARRSEYVIEAKLSALVVAFPYAGFKAEAEKQVNDAALQKYFEANKFLFSGKDGKEPEFAAVKADVATRFVAAQSRDLAVRRAYDFASKAYESVSEVAGTEKAAEFRKLAAAEKAELVETGLVEVTATEFGKIKSSALMQQLAASVESSPVTNAVPGDDAAYVGFVLERVAAKPAEFNDVNKQISADFLQAEAMELARKAAADALTRLQGVTDQAARRKAFSELKGCSFKQFEFSAQKQPPEGFEAAARVAVNLRPGEISAVVPVPNGAVLVDLLKRIPADMKDFEAKRAEYETRYRFYKEQMAGAAFEEELSSQCALAPEFQR